MAGYLISALEQAIATFATLVSTTLTQNSTAVVTCPVTQRFDWSSFQYLTFQIETDINRR